MENIYFVSCQIDPKKARYKDGGTLQLFKLGLFTGKNLNIAKQKAKEYLKQTTRKNPNHFKFYAIITDPNTLPNETK